MYLVRRLSMSIVFVVFITVLLASCTPPIVLPTETPTLVPTSTLTATPVPTATKTPKPTSTPNFVATQIQEDALARVQDYYEQGYLASTNGHLYTLSDYSQEMAKINYLDFANTGYNQKTENFVVWGDFEWESAGPVNYPEYSGCGFGYRVQEAGDWYTAILANDAVWMGYCDTSLRRCGRLGTTSGTGRVDYGNPAQAEFTLIVNEDHAYVFVDGEFVGEYTLFKEKLRDPGYVLYGIISGTNRDFGTSCEATNVKLWVSR